jgi:hypothetical protein
MLDPAWACGYFSELLRGSCAQVAQSVEQRIENPRVGGSIPSLGKFLRQQKFPYPTP